MSPEAAKIFWVEDDKDFVEVRSEFCRRAGHKVVLTASSREEVTEKIPLMKEVGVQVAIVDGNLSQGDESGWDGEAVAKEIKTASPEVVVIGNSLRKPIANADVNCPKVEGAAKLVQVITQA